MTALIVTLTGPSCSGKSHVAEILSSRHGFGEVTSTTTRDARPNEVNGQHYHFVTPEQFQAAVDAGEMLEHIGFNGQHYGATREAFSTQFARGRPVAIVVEPNGAVQVKRNAEALGWQCITVFIDCPVELAFRRHAERYALERAHDQVKAAGSCAKRLVQAASIERDWRIAADYDHVFGASQTPADADHIVARILEAAERVIAQPAASSSAHRLREPLALGHRDAAHLEARFVEALQGLRGDDHHAHARALLAVAEPVLAERLAAHYSTAI
ncbi:guanylate kinase [Natronocella acetinitrilica]|uniref:Guanylate kinase n=1 Tax=Natronocella acetinitrilica TaxID=414046 RepID=A0AAE3G2G4_9GAMM|nr:hypothetical protein [Natronocella acetinitrilica]MCP1674192.1 guanylate kinase [Natronocella acetinitrilica]